MALPSKENFRLLDMSSDEESEDLQLEIIPSRKKKVTRRDRSRGGAAPRLEPNLGSEVCCAVNWAIRGTLLLWLVMLTWICAAMYEQVTMVKLDVDKGSDLSVLTSVLLPIECLIWMDVNKYLNMNNEENNIKFCGLVEQHRVLYDHTMSDYHNRNVSDRAWAKIAQILKTTVSTSSDSVGDALQVCHTAAKELRANTSSLNLRLTKLEQDHLELAKQVEQAIGELTVVSGQLAAAPELREMPKRLNDLQRTVAELGSQINGFDGAINTAKKQAVTAAAGVEEVKTSLHQLEGRTNETIANITASMQVEQDIKNQLVAVNNTLEGKVAVLAAKVQEISKPVSTLPPVTTSSSTVPSTTTTSTTSTTTLPPGPPAKPSVLQ